MKIRQILFWTLCTSWCAVSLRVVAQTTAPEHLFKEGKSLFEQKAYEAAEEPLQKYLKQTKASPDNADFRMEAAYMLACADYEQQSEQRMEALQGFLDAYPDSPYENRVQALMGAACFYEEDYEEALKHFQMAKLELLGNKERDDMTYRMAISYLQMDELSEAAAWLEVLRTTSTRYEDDCSYYLAYIRYTQGRYEEALADFQALQDVPKYEALVPYYIAEIYLLNKEYGRAEQVAQSYRSRFADQPHAAEMQRIQGTVDYHNGRYMQAMKAFADYFEKTSDARRDARYMMGLSCYQCGVYSEVPVHLDGVTREADVLAQNAWLHTGLAYLQLAEKNKARLAFEQAATSDADRSIKEQAAFNYALCIHETAYSAFGESVTVFEKFLNEFPQSPYADKVSSYLVDVYMTTRSYEAALQSIERIAQPTASILEAKQKILFQLGTQSFANAQFQQAIAYFDKSIELGKYNIQTKADAYYWRGESYYRLNRLDEAERNFKDYQYLTPQRQHPMFALASYNLGYIDFRNKKYNAALEKFNFYVGKEKTGNPSLLADAYNRMGDCYLNSRRFDEATTYYTKAENLNTSAGDYAYYQLALVAGLQKDYDRKVALLNQLANKYPQSPYVVNSLYEKGRSFVQGGKSAQAISVFSELANKYPDSPVGRKAAAEIGLLYYQNEDYDKAIEAYKKVVEHYPGSEEARLAMRDLKSLYVDANRVDEFAALAAQMPDAIRFEATEQDSLTYIAAEKVYMKGEKASAKSSFERYLQSYPNGAFALNAHYYLAVMAKQNGEEEEVLAHTTELLKYPDTPYAEEALLMHGELLYNRKQYAEAMADYKQLQARASTAERRQIGMMGVLRCASLLGDRTEIIHAATALLSESKLSPEWQEEARYCRGKAYLLEKAYEKAIADLQVLAKDTRTAYGAEAKYLVAQQLYEAGNYVESEKEVLDFIEKSTPHAYWLARAFVLLADVYVATDKPVDARQYLLSLQQNYQADDDIAAMIESRLKTLEK